MEKIALMGTPGKSVRWIKRNDYQKFYELILDELKTSSCLMLQELIDKAALKLNKEFPASYSWILLQVKHDMEARGLIKTDLNFLKQQTIRISADDRLTIL